MVLKVLRATLLSFEHYFQG